MLEQAANQLLEARWPTGVAVAPCIPSAILSLRAIGASHVLGSIVRTALGIELPPMLAVASWAGGRVCCIRPNEWWLIHGGSPANGILIDDALLGDAGAALDMSDALVGYRVSGSRAPDLLATGSVLDTSAGALRVGRCARVRLADLPVVLVGDEDGVELYIGRSYRNHFETWFESVKAVL